MDMPSLNRRDILKVSLLGSAALALPLQSSLSASSASTLAASRMPKPYMAAFKAPPVMAPTVRDDVAGNSYGQNPRNGVAIPGSEYGGTDYYRITQTPCEVGFISGVKTQMWGYNGQVPGPTIRSYKTAGKPRRVVMQQINNLPATHPTLGYVPWTSTHLHGSPSKPQYDGYAGDLTQPGEWKNYQYPNNCTPRTLWYHDHGVHHTAENVYMGLAAQYHVVDSELERQLGIPRYNPALPTAHPAQYEAPLILSDVKFAASGQLMWDDESHSGVYGDVILVNGVPWPNMKVEPRTYRFRVLNGSISRGYRLKLSNGKSFQVIATDGGFMRNPQTVTQFTIGMAERYEIVIDFAGLAGTKVQLLNSGVKNARDFDHTGKVMQFEVGTTITSTEGNTVPADFGTGHSAMSLTAGMATATRRMRLAREGELWVINNETWDDVVKTNYEHTFAKTQANAVEIWEVENKSGGWFHPLHVHLVDFQVLSRNGKPPRPEEKGPKDVVYVGEGETVRLLMKFEHEEGRYMIHCHNLSHEDHDMMTQYQVGHHDIDCDSINTDPPQPLPAPALGAQQPAARQASTDTGSTPTAETTDSTAAPETTAATPTPTTAGSTGTETTGTGSTGSASTTPPTPTSAAPTTSSGRGRGRGGR